MKTRWWLMAALLLGPWQLGVADMPHQPSASHPPAKKTFDFTPPAITTLFSAAEIERYAKLLPVNVEEVNVEADRPAAEATLPSNWPSSWHVAPWLFAPRNTSLQPDATAANATLANPPPFAGQPRSYDR